MGLCTAPCTREIDLASYGEDVTAVKRFLEGETGVLADPLRREMEAAAQDRNFERAANLRDRLETVEAFHGEGGEAVQSIGDERGVDVLGVAIEGADATVARLRAEDGKLVDRDRHTLEAPGSAGTGVDAAGRTDGVPAVLAAFIVQYYAERELPDACSCRNATATRKSQPGSQPRRLGPGPGRGPGGEARRTRVEKRPP